MRLAGSDYAPSLADAARYEGWKSRFSEEMLRLAAETSRGKGRVVAAMDSLLAAWEQEGVTTPEQARARAKSGAGGRTFDNPALHYAQRQPPQDVDDLFVDVVKEYGGAEK